jgi:hypothetical protein
MRIPNRHEVARAFSEKEAFAHAGKLYSDWITTNTPPPSAGIVAEREAAVFRPALELQLAGLSMLSGTDMKAPMNLIVSFSCFSVDHLLWGWFAAVNFHPRIAFSLSRSAVEAAIFSVAAATDYAQFKTIWNTRQGTGGAVLKVLKNVPGDLRWLLNTAWQVMAKLGHASDGPVLSSMTSFSDAGEVRTGISFAGQFGGALDARQLDGCVDSFCIAATANVEVMNLCLRPEFTTSDEWSRRFDTLRQHLDKREPIPPERAEHYERYRKRFGPRPESSNRSPTTP